MSVWQWHNWLPEVDEINRFSRGEGNTSLVRSVRIGRELGMPNLYFKLENLNPTGSYKDRFACAVVSTMLQKRQRFCVSTSSGNTGSALAAYCAAANIKCLIALVDGTPEDKRLQMKVYGAQLLEVRDFGKDAIVTQQVFDILAAFALEKDIPFPVSAYKFFPEGMKGVETIAYEIMESGKPDHIFSPAGGGGLTLAVAKGAKRFSDEKSLALPHIHCVQPFGNNTIAGPLLSGARAAIVLEKSGTTISGLQVPGVLDGNDVISLCRASGGTGHLVTDEEVFHWHKALATEEGIFCEPAAAVALAGAANAVKYGVIQPHQHVVCLVTGSGFKNLAVVRDRFGLPATPTIESGQFGKYLEQFIND